MADKIMDLFEWARKEERRAKDREYYAANRAAKRDKARASMAKWRASHHTEEAARQRNRRARDPERFRDIQREWVNANRERIKKQGRTRHQKNPQQKRDQQKQWRDANPDKQKTYRQRAYAKIRIDINLKIANELRWRLVKAMRRKSKAGSAVRDLGCSIPEFRAYIEGRFLPGMSWSNWSRTGWHLDHIRPLAIFDLTNPAQFWVAAHFSNYQPLWAIDNLRKGSRPGAPREAPPTPPHRSPQ